MHGCYFFLRGLSEHDVGNARVGKALDRVGDKSEASSHFQTSEEDEKVETLGQ